MEVETSQLTESEPAGELQTAEEVLTTPSSGPACSRYGRARKPKLSVDFVAHDKNIKNFLSPGASRSNTSVNGEVLSNSKRKSISKEKSEENSKLNEASSPYNDTRSFLVNSNNLPEAYVKIETPLRIENSTPDIAVRTEKKGRKRKIQTPSTGGTFPELLPGNSESGGNSGAENVDPAAKSSPLMNGLSEKPKSKPGRKPKLTIDSETAANLIASNTNSEPETCASSSTATVPMDTSSEIVTTPSQILSGDGKQSESASTLTESTPTSASASLSPSSHLAHYAEFIGDPEKNWSVGDVVWGSIGKHPYWPSIIMKDPVSKTHFIEKGGKRGTSGKTYFLQFCADNGRHCWLYARNLLEFIDKKQFQDLREKLGKMPRTQSKLISTKFTLKSSHDLWDRAVAEATYLSSLPREDRILHFQRLYPVEPQRTKKDILELLMKEEEPPKPSINGESASSSNKPQKSKSPVSPQPVSSPSQRKKTIIKNNAKQKLKVAKVKGRKPLKLSLKEKALSNKKLMLLKRKKKLKMQSKKEKKNKVKRAYNKTKSVDNSEVTNGKNESKSLAESTEPKVEKTAESAKKVKPENSVVKKRRKKKEAFGPDFDVYCSKNFDRIADEHPELKEKEIEKYLQKMWLEMDEMHKLKYKSRLVKEDLSADEKECEASAGEASDSGSTDDANKKATPPPIVEAVSKVKKSNALFR